MPSWLIPYPGANAATLASSASLVEIGYTTSAKPDEVVAHYRRLFETAGLRSNSNFDGSGTSIRAGAAECDLLIKIREDNAGTNARVSCAAKSAALLCLAGTLWSPADPADYQIRERLSVNRWM
jgi:hypothetical protein